MRFALIDGEKAEFPVRTMCRVLDVSESGFFAWKRAACQPAPAGRHGLSGAYSDRLRVIEQNLRQPTQGPDPSFRPR